MYRLFTLSSFLVVVLAVPFEKCAYYGKYKTDCCKKEVTKELESNEQLMIKYKDCIYKSSDPVTCEVQTCMAKAEGVLSEDGTLDRSALAKSLKVQFESNPALYEQVLEHCVNADLSNYVHPQYCEYQKMLLCIDMQKLKSCSDWKDDGECKGIGEFANECVKEFL